MPKGSKTKQMGRNASERSQKLNPPPSNLFRKQQQKSEIDSIPSRIKELIHLTEFLEKISHLGLSSIDDLFQVDRAIKLMDDLLQRHVRKIVGVAEDTYSNFHTSSLTTQTEHYYTPRFRWKTADGWVSKSLNDIKEGKYRSE